MSVPKIDTTDQFNGFDVAPAIVPELEDQGDETSSGPYPSPAQPMSVARRLMADLFTTGEGHRTLTYWRGDWWTWEGASWQLVEDEFDVKEPIWHQLEQAVTLDKDGEEKAWSPTTSRVHNIMEPLAIRARIAGAIDAPAWLDETTDPAANRLISLRNGLLDLKTLSMVPHTPALFNTWSLDFDYDPEATCHTWNTFLADVFAHDEKGAALLQEYAGYLISGRMEKHKALLIVGPGRSGKGTISRTLKQLVGVANTVSPSLNSIGSEFGLAELIGKPLAIVEDARGDDDRRNNTTVERLLNITGEDSLSINRKGISYWNGTLPTRFLLISNEMPRFLDSSGAILNRFMSVKLEKSYEDNPDTTLGARINGELSGIFNWALDGLRRLDAQGHFTRPETMSEMHDLMGDLAAPVSKFLDEQYIITGDPEDRVKLKEVHAKFKAWCEDVDMKPLNQSTFQQRMVAADPRVTFKNTVVPGYRKDRWFFGIQEKDW